MPQRKSTFGRLVGAAGLTCTVIFAGLSFASLPAGAQTAPSAPVACPVLSIGNPNPGDTLMPGGYVISGTAYDPSASSGSGIARVDLFLGERDNGGTFLGSAVPGATGSDPRAFTTQVTVPALNRGVTFAAYAISSLTSQQTSVTFPVLVGTLPRSSGVATPTPTPSAPVVTSTCPQGATSTTTTAVSSAPAPAAPAASAAPAAPVVSVPASAPLLTGAAACPTLSIANPNPGDFVSVGGYVISGSASDPAATSGSGVARVDLFLGDRDSGGTILGTAVPGDGTTNPTFFTVKVTIPNLGRGIDFAAYAISAITGQETAVTFPVFVGAPPTRTSSATPTPIPTTLTTTTTCH